jgi:serine protease
VLFKLSYSAPSASYQDQEFFTTTVNLDYQNIKVNQVYTSITSNGRVGFSGENATNGLGFIYKDFSLLYEAALMVGNANNRVSNNVRGLNGVSDNHFNKLIKVSKVSNTTAAYEGVATFNDALSPTPLNIEVKNRQIAYKDAPDDKYVVVEYEIFNKSAATLNNIYAALFTDWDVDDGAKNLVKYDANLKMGYTYASTPLSPYAGVKLLTNSASPIFYPLSYMVTGDPLQDGSFTIAEKYTTLSSGIKATSLGTAIGNGSFTIPVNGSVKLAFAFIAGDNLTDISNSAIAAQSKYTQILTAVDSDVELTGFNVSQNAPNPAKQQTQIIVDLPGNGKTSIEVYDLAGKKVLMVLNKDLKKGKHTIDLDVSNLNSGIYFYKTKFENLEKVMKMVVIK